MTRTDWIVLGALAFVVLAIFLGRRKGRSQFQRHTQEVAAEARAEGAAEAMAAMQATLQQHVTVVAGNDGRLDHSGSASLGILDRVRADLAVPGLSEREALIRAFQQEALDKIAALDHAGQDGDALYRRPREAHELQGYPGRQLVSVPLEHAPECACGRCDDERWMRLRRADL